MKPEQAPDLVAVDVRVRLDPAANQLSVVSRDDESRVLGTIKDLHDRQAHFSGMEEQVRADISSGRRNVAANWISGLLLSPPIALLGYEAVMDETPSVAPEITAGALVLWGISAAVHNIASWRGRVWPGKGHHQRLEAIETAQVSG